ncbi:beta-mannosidase [Deinococcus marmoris]|uniref:Beta-mannosidase B n=1 Tax=Deinococcus marmoris TaxID=249408 RepID=A0A1U7P003_9DEIO|nr:glycoside hydrolase family 2 protein [Deinococcus marmoris]OLV18503.1 Beta-mannosidase [Deinococcus marmoris]
MTHTLPLHAGWQFKARAPQTPLNDDFAADSDWAAASVPGTVHQDLLATGRIPDPNVGLNELDVQWVGETDWLYQLEFDAPSMESGEQADLCFDGLDTFAKVWLNGELILESENMFVPRRVSVAGQLREGSNELRVLFSSALLRGQGIEAELGKRQLWNGDSSRLYVRKAQYHYGWDWGPVLMTAGLWRGVRLEVYAARLDELACPVSVSDDFKRAEFPVSVDVKGKIAGNVVLELLGPDGAVVASETRPAAGSVAHTFSVENPALWWPAGHGEQPLYTVRAGLEDGTSSELRVGVRSIRLIQEPVADEPGSSFFFEVNGMPIFCGGANWIPDDNFLPRISPERYRTRLTQARDANMVMIRVWGGGIYEDDVFYDVCDELGLLVWQDFMFACGMYPAHTEFQASIREEAEVAVRRLRHHASLALWCGNNEDYQIANSVGAYGPGGDESKFDALSTYEELLPEVCSRLNPATPYWPGSAFGGPNSTDQEIGDRHTWDVWHGAMAPYQDYPKYEGRFVAEFGMQSLPSLALLESVVAPEERFPASRTLEHHNKAGDGPRRLNVYIGDTVPIPADLPGYVYASQLMQAEALDSAYRGWRRRWGRDGKRAVSGALVWQLNDCWPVTSWAIIDSSGQPKPAYYAIKGALKPVSVGVTVTGKGAEVWAVNGTTEVQTVTLDLRALTLEGKELSAETRELKLAANEVTELGIFAAEHDAASTIVAATLNQDGSVIAREVRWPEPFKYLTLPDPGLKVEVTGPNALSLSVTRPAKGVWLESAPETVWDDNMLDLLPGETRVVRTQKLSPSNLTARWLGAEETVRVGEFERA